MYSLLIANIIPYLVPVFNNGHSTCHCKRHKSPPPDKMQPFQLTEPQPRLTD